MKILLRLSFLIAALAWLPPAQAQVSNPAVIWVTTDPAGACANTAPLQYNYTNEHLSACFNGTWAVITAGGAGTGTVTQVVIAGTAAQITATGTCTITTTGTCTFSIPSTFTFPGTVTNNLSIFGSTTSAQLAGVISNETGSGLLVFNTAPSLSALALSDVATGTQCLHANSSGVVSGTGSDCGSGGGGSGTVTVVGSGNLGSTQIVTGGGSQTVQTPSSAATVDSSGNITASSIALGGAANSCNGTAGCYGLGQGTAPSGQMTTGIMHYAPTSVTSYKIVEPGAAATGIPHYTNSSNVITTTITAIVAADLPNAGVHTGDAAGTFPVVTLATVNSNTGTFGDATHVGQFTVNAKGLITAVTSVAISGGGGSGTVTVVGSGNLTSTALVTGGGSQTLQTPAVTATMDSSGNVSTPGTVATGVGSGLAGYDDLQAGTAHTFTGVGHQAPTTVTTPYGITFPGAPTTGFVLRTGTSDPQVETIVGSSGSGNVVRVTSATMVTPTLGAALATSINGLTLTSSTGVFTLTNAKTLAVTNTLTLSGTDSTVMTFPATSASVARIDAAQTFTGVQTFSTPIALTSLASTVVNASSPGAGIAHFAGSTQTVTSSAVSLTADVSGVLPTANIAVALANQTSIHGITAGTAAGNATLGQVIASGATALDFASTATGACATVITATATGAASTDVVIFNANASIKAVTGYVPASTGGFSVAAFATTNTVNFEACNWTSGTVDPGSFTANWVILR